MRTEWALDQLDRFEQVVGMPAGPNPQTLGQRSHFSQALGHRVIEEQAYVVEHIFDRLGITWGGVPVTASTRWSDHLRAVNRARAMLRRREEVERELGPSAPKLTASHLHDWVWAAAQSSWSAGLHTHAVSDALNRLNAETQRKGQRPDLSETDLFKQLFSVDDPQPGKPRLRLVGPENPKTFTSRHRGASNYAEGLYSAVRNVLSHTVTVLPEDEALELLAAISVLARWVDQAKLQAAP